MSSNEKERSDYLKKIQEAKNEIDNLKDKPAEQDKVKV